MTEVKDIEIVNEKALDYQLTLRKKKFGKQTFDDIFAIQDLSLIWLYCRFFLVQVMPGPLKHSFKAFEKRPKVNLQEKIYSEVSSNLLKHYFHFSDTWKRSSFKKKHLRKADVLFISFPSQIKRNKQGFTIYHTNNMINKIKEDKKVSYNVLVVPELSSFAPMKSLSKNFDIMYQYITQKEIDAAKTKSAELYKKWKAIDKKEIPHWKYMKYFLNTFFSKQFLFLTALHIYTLKKILKESKVKVAVLLGRTSLAERIVLGLSK